MSTTKKFTVNQFGRRGIFFDKFGSKAWPLFGVSFIRSEKFGA